jgi:hypothetical protein
MLKVCASICCVFGGAVILYIVGSGATGHSSASAPSWIYAHY